MKHSRFSWAIALPALLLILGIAPTPVLAQQTDPTMESAIFQWTNIARQYSGRGTLKINPQLTKAAQRHAANMAWQDTMSHSLDGESVADRARRAGYASTFVGENIAFNFGYSNPAWQLFDGWMKSEGHLRNIMNNDYTEIGVGVVRAASGKYFACQVFGSPMPQTIPYAPTYGVTTRTSPSWLTTQSTSDFRWYYIPEWD